MNETDKYFLLQKYHSFLKRIQQLSWHIDRFNRRYPLDQVDEAEFESLTNAYKEFMAEVVNISKDWQKEVDPNKIID